jgi:glycosyltransferase involved in cell wall biosynthesis
MSPPFLDGYAAYKERRDREQPAPPGEQPLVSVVTVMLNAADTVERTIRSVHTQSFSDIEHVLVDGGSTDSTLDIVRKLVRPQDCLITEADQGISDAFNKGIALARGRFINILNADDWMSQDQIERAMRALIDGGHDFVFGDVTFYDGDQPIFRSVGDARYQRVIRRRMPTIGHPSMLAARSCFERIGLFDPAYQRAMDYDWLLRLHLAGGCGDYRPEIVGHMTHAGVSNREFRETIDEVRRVAIAHGRSPLVAGAEAHLRRMKTAASLPIKQHARPLYHLVRGLINRSYKPVATSR